MSGAQCADAWMCAGPVRRRLQAIQELLCSAFVVQLKIGRAHVRQVTAI